MHRDSDRGAYGFRLVSADPDLELPDLVEAPADAETVTISWHQASASVDRSIVTSDRAVLAIRGQGHLDVRRNPGSIFGAVPEATFPDAIVHPLCSLPLSILAYWRGNTTLHGGAFFYAGKAWGVCGEQMAGKSSLLASLGALGIPILADDLIVADGTRLLAGPNCVDLRPDAATRFPGASSIGVVAGRERHRLRTPPSPAEADLGGLLLLEWGDDAGTDAVPLTADERLKTLFRHHYTGAIGPPSATQALAFLDVPMWHLRRSRDWDRAAAGAAELLALIDSWV